MEDLKLSAETLHFIHDSYQRYKMTNNDEITVDEFLNKKLTIRDSFTNLVSTNQELKWIKDTFNPTELEKTRSKYSEKRNFFKDSTDANIDNNFKISVAKNAAAEVFVQKELDIIDLRAQHFKVIFCDDAKLTRPEWILLSHRKTWFEHDRPYLNKKYGIIVSVRGETPYIAAIIDRKTFNAKATMSKHTQHLILHKSEFDKCLLNIEDVRVDLYSNLIYQTHIDQKTFTAINRLKKAHFNELKNTQEMFELIIDFWHDNHDTQYVQAKIEATAQNYAIDSKKRLINYNKLCKDKLHDLLRAHPTWKLELLARTAFNNPEVIKNWYLKI